MDKRVLVVSAGIFHPTISARRLFHNILRGIEGVKLVATSSIEDLGSLKGGSYDAVCLYFHRKHISDDSLEALKDFIASGGGFFAVHSASASFKEIPKYFDILGGRFVSHDKVSDFTVVPSDSGDKIFKGIGPFTVKDELYIHEYSKDVKVQFQTKVNDSMEPVVWTKEHGKGRVCYFSLGHVASIFKKEEAHRIIERGMKWVCGA